MASILDSLKDDLKEKMTFRLRFKNERTDPETGEPATIRVGDYVTAHVYVRNDSPVPITIIGDIEKTRFTEFEKVSFNKTIEPTIPNPLYASSLSGDFRALITSEVPDALLDLMNKFKKSFDSPFRKSSLPEIPKGEAVVEVNASATANIGALDFMDNETLFCEIAED